MVSVARQPQRTQPIAKIHVAVSAFCGVVADTRIAPASNDPPPVAMMASAIAADRRAPAVLAARSHRTAAACGLAARRIATPSSEATRYTAANNPS